jgi:hypothetical protein
MENTSRAKALRMSRIDGTAKRDVEIFFGIHKAVQFYIFFQSVRKMKLSGKKERQIHNIAVAVLPRNQLR